MANLRLVGRWATFNAVGVMGGAVQLSVLALLVRWAGLSYLAATIVAVEAALLHNFVWHQRWTWRDRPVTTAAAVAVRLARFHMTNGGVSFVGNLAVMAVLAGALGLDPVAANVAAVVGCSLINFTTGTTLVFRVSPAATAR